MLKKINAGCSEGMVSDHINIDLRDLSDVARAKRCWFVQGDICDLYELLGGSEERFTHIRCIYAVEHLPLERLYECFWNWNRVLEMGGEVKIVVPDFESAVEQYQQDKGLSMFRRLCYEITGGAEPGSDTHNTLWTIEWLDHFLMSEGFECVSSRRRVGVSNMGLEAIFKKTQEKLSTAVGGG